PPASPAGRSRTCRPGTRSPRAPAGCGSRPAWGPRPDRSSGTAPGAGSGPSHAPQRDQLEHAVLGEVRIVVEARDLERAHRNDAVLELVVGDRPVALEHGHDGGVDAFDGGHRLVEAA